MKVKFSGLVIASASGGIGGNVVLNGKFGQILQVKSIPQNTNQKYRQRHKAMIAFINNLWKDLTETERKSWYRIPGEKLSGHALFLSRNTYLYLANYPTIRTYVPPKAYIIKFLSIGVDYRNTGHIFLDWVALTSSIHVTTLLFASRPYGTNRKVKRPSWSKVISADTSLLRHTEFTIDYEANYGKLGGTGTRIFWKLIALEIESGNSWLLKSSSSVRPA